MSSTTRSLSAILAVAILSPLAAAQDELCTLEVRTATVTECFPNTGTPVTPSCRASCPTPMASGHPNGPVFVEVEAPKCDSCGCDTCVHTHVYTTNYDAFCPTGIAKQEYVVTETYSGMSGKPTMPSATGMPFGFTAGVKTCNECGDKPVTATITYPATGCPYILGMSEPTGAPEGVPAYEVCTTGTGPSGAEETAPIEGPSKGGPGSGSGSSSGPGSGPGTGAGSSPGSGAESSPGSGSGSSPGSNTGSSPGSGSGTGSSPGSGSGSGSSPGSSAAPGGGNNGGFETSPESESGSAPVLDSGKGSYGEGSSPAGSSGSSAGSESPPVGSTGSNVGTGSSGGSPGWNSNSGSSPVGSSGSEEGSGSSPGSESMPGMSGSASSPAGTGSNGYSETSGGHPTFMAVTMGGVLGFFISFLAFTL